MARGGANFSENKNNLLPGARYNSEPRGSPLDYIGIRCARTP